MRKAPGFSRGFFYAPLFCQQDLQPTVPFATLPLPAKQITYGKIHMKDSTRFHYKDVKLVSQETCFQGYFRMDRLTVRHPTFEGGLSDDIRREVFVRGNAVACLPYDPVSDKVVLIEQFRAGAYANGREDCWLIEPVAGIIEPGETPEEVAIRESLEEANCEILDLVEAGRHLTSPGAMDEEVVLFIGRCDADKVNGIHGLDEEGEDIRAFSIDFQSALDAAMHGKISNILTVTTLYWLALNRDDLRLQWERPK